MKGQFMLISSILIGFIVISAASTISEVQSQSFETSSLGNDLEMIEEEAEKVDHSSEKEIQNFQEMVSLLSGYQTSVNHWPTQQCFNVTLNSPDREAVLTCI